MYINIYKYVYIHGYTYITYIYTIYICNIYIYIYIYIKFIYIYKLCTSGTKILKYLNQKQDIIYVYMHYCFNC